MAGQTLAQDTPTTGGDQKAQKPAGTSRDCGKFVDADKNGVCDNWQSRGKDGKGANFTDANGDGVCDHNPDGKAGCQGKEGCCRGQQNGGQGAKEQGCQFRNNCAGHCPEKGSPGKK